MSDKNDKHTQHVELHAPGLERAIRDAAKDVADAMVDSATILATAIGALVPPPPPRIQITSGAQKFDPQKTGDSSMATPINTALPQHVSELWTGVDANGNTVNVTPDSVTFSVSPASAGTYTPDADGVSGATFVAAPGATGDVTFSAVSHQAGLADFTQVDLVGTLTTTPPAAIQITGGAQSFDPQVPPSVAPAARAGAAYAGGTVRRG